MDNTFKTTKIPTIKRIRFLAYKGIFDKLNDYEKYELDYGITQYPKMANLSKDKRQALRSIIGILLIAEQGGFDEKKEEFKRLGVDYRMVYGLW